MSSGKISPKRVAQENAAPSHPIPMDRASSGVPGFDELSHGGLVKNRAYLVLGSPGCGKTIFSMQFIYAGAAKFKENGVYLTAEEPPDQLRHNMSTFGWDLKKLEDELKLVLLDASAAKIGIASDERHVVSRPSTLDTVLFEVYKSIKEVNARRVVIDSLDALEIHKHEESDFRTFMLKLITLLKSFYCTALIIAEQPEGNVGSRRGIESFVSDGIIRLLNVLDGNQRQKKLEVLKLRGSSHVSGLVPFRIDNDGIRVLNETEMQSLMRRIRPRSKAQEQPPWK